MSFSGGPAGQPLENKRQSPFHQFSPHIPPLSLFYSCLLPLCFCFIFSPSRYLIFIPSLPLLELSSLLRSVDIGRSSAPVWAIKSFISGKNTNLFARLLCVDVFFLFVDMRARRDRERERDNKEQSSIPPFPVNHHLFLMDSLSHIPLIMALCGHLASSHKGIDLILFHFPCTLSPSSLLRGFTHHLIGLNQLWQGWSPSHTPCLQGRPHYETITPLIDS